jgi:alkylation response protein AidB-like acyl-CoA dehydrogenase
MNEQRADSDGRSENRELQDIDSPLGSDEQIWQRFAGELGLASLNVPEALGGGGATFAEHCLVLEELGSTSTGLPYLSFAGYSADSTQRTEQHDHKRIQPARPSATRWDVLTACHRSWAVMITL